MTTLMKKTLDSKLTTHVTAMVLYQTNPNECLQSEKIDRIPLPTTQVEDKSISCQIIKKCVGVHNKPTYHTTSFKTNLNAVLDANSNQKDLIWALGLFVE